MSSQFNDSSGIENESLDAEGISSFVGFSGFGYSFLLQKLMQVVIDENILLADGFKL